jgi:hypothetical protein
MKTSLLIITYMALSVLATGCKQKNELPPDEVAIFMKQCSQKGLNGVTYSYDACKCAIDKVIYF